MQTLSQDTVPVNEPWALKNLPPFPWITTKVLQLYATDGNEIAVKRLTELIRSDAALSSELLRRANSALYGLRSEVGSVERAVTMIGLDQVRSLAMTLSLGSFVKTSMRVAVLRRCWRHSLGCAMLSEELAETCGIRPDQAYTAGLLHDVGRLALLVKYPESYADLLSVVIENNFSMLQSERDLFDLDHCEAGAWLAESWDFPKELISVIADHHNPGHGSRSPLVELIHASCRLAESLGFDVTTPETTEDPAAILEQLPNPVRLSPADIEAIRLHVTEKVNGLE